MAESVNPILKITELQQVCVVVNNLDKTIRDMRRVFGIEPWDIYEVKADSMRDMTYHGKPGSFGYKVAKLHNKLGGFEIEVIEPREGDSIYRDFLNEHGEGVQHIGWYKAESHEAFTTIAQNLEKAGFSCLMSARNSRCVFAYFDTTSVLHTVLEVIWWDPTVTPVPNRVFPA